MTTGEKIYELRKKARITQEDFADKLGVTHQAVSKWESNTAFPETDTIIKIAELFGVSCDYLLKDGAAQHDNLIDNRRRSFLSMMVSFAIAVCVAGYVVALICYYAIDNKYSAFIGFGVLAGFLLIGFILWTVGRYLFLSKCDWADADKQHLAKLTTAFFFTAIIALFCYLPAVLTGISIASTLIFGCAGITVALLVHTAHKSMLGEKPQKVRLCDSICACACALTAVGVFTATVYETIHPIIYGDVDTPSFVSVAVFSFIVMIALIAQSTVRRKAYSTPKLLYSLQITNAVLVFLNGIIFSISHCYHFEGGSSDFYRSFAILLSVVALLQIIFSAVYAKRGKKNVLPTLLYALPFYVFMWCMQIGCYFFLRGTSALVYLAWLLVVLNVYSATVQIAETVKTKKPDRQ